MFSYHTLQQISLTTQTLSSSRFHSVITRLYSYLIYSILSRPPDSTAARYHHSFPQCQRRWRWWRDDRNRERERESMRTSEYEWMSSLSLSRKRVVEHRRRTVFRLYAYGGYPRGNVGRHGNIRAPPVTLTFGTHGVYAWLTVILCTLRILYRIVSPYIIITRVPLKD